MNKRIKELLKQATTDINPDDREWVFSRIDQEKFAELIVAECIDIADEYDGVGSTIVGRIQKHFGVQE